ncbi:sulfite exporter TauE/SafE family protein [Agromyces terreus]|uniref:sulfite exporter TauE/SafE family protein n=1 Tax=Agromyces terreus TaxID=424795 RepID=UPI0031D7E406
MPSPTPPDARPRARGLWLRVDLVDAAGGLLSGAFGVGGGILMVPLLIVFAHMDQRHATATSLAAIVPASIAGSITYLVNGEVDLVAALFVAIGGVIGSWIGTWLLRRLPIVWLRWLFIALLVAIAVRMLLVVPERGGGHVGFDLLPDLALFALGIGVGIASGLFGIGGGAIMVPAFIAFFGMGDLMAKGTSLAVMIPTAISGTVANSRAKLVDLHEALVVGAAATVASFAGVGIAFLLSPEWSARLFAAFVIVAAVQLAVRAIRAQRRPRPPETPDAPESAR